VPPALAALTEHSPATATRNGISYLHFKTIWHMFVVKVTTDLCYPFCRRHFNQMYQQIKRCHKLGQPWNPNPLEYKCLLASELYQHPVPMTATDVRSSAIRYSRPNDRHPYHSISPAQPLHAQQLTSGNDWSALLVAATNSCYRYVMRILSYISN